MVIYYICLIKRVTKLMNKTQLDNFINFCFNFHTECGNSFIDSDYTYIYEKWSKYIGVTTTKKDVNKNIIINKWIEKWKVNESKWNSLKEIVEFLYILNTRPLLLELQTWKNVNFNTWTLEELINVFKETTGLDIIDINDSEYLNLHFNIKKVVIDWVEKPVNMRVYKLSQIGI